MEELNCYTESMPKKLIVMEGLDGSGKSTQASMLASRINKHPNHKATVIQNPGFGPIGCFIREEMLTGKVSVGRQAERLIYAADKYQRIEVVLNILNRGEFVIMDRYIMSSKVYQGNPEDMEESSVIIDDISPRILPYMNFYMAAPVELSIQRVRERKKNMHVHEVHASMLLFKKLYDQVWEQERKSKEGNWIEVDSSGDAESVHEYIWSQMLQEYPEYFGKEHA